MALVTIVLGNCPGCGAENSFGNVDVWATYVYRGCKHCRYSENVPLPQLRKSVLYLDHFFFVHAFRGNEERFVDAAKRIAHLSKLQLLAVPFSSIHEDETHQWERREELHEFIKATSRGHEFSPAYEIERKQLVAAFQVWLKDAPPSPTLDPRHALPAEVHNWDSYFRIDVGRYMGNVELIRHLKQRSVATLVDEFPRWRATQTTFDDDLQNEYASSARGYIDSYIEYVARVGGGDHSAFWNAPIMSHIAESLMYCMPEQIPVKQRWRKCAEFMFSDSFKAVPYQNISSRMFAALRASVKAGAYRNRQKALERLSGVFYDVTHISTYAPYVDAFIMDAAMADLVSKPTVDLERVHGTKVFCVHNWDKLISWLDSLEANMSDEHKAGLLAAYPPRQRR